MNIPSVPVLRAFIEVARCNSFTRAADTLCLTQSAVSKQVQALEEQLGCRLFVRSGKLLALTPAGYAYLAHASDALAMLQDGMAIAQEVAGEKTPAAAVEISASPAFASYWLIPRLPGFRERAPGTRLAVRPRLPDFSPVTERFDLEGRGGAGRWPDARAIRLLGREMALVASPDLLGTRAPRCGRSRRCPCCTARSGAMTGGNGARARRPPGRRAPAAASCSKDSRS